LSKKIGLLSSHILRNECMNVLNPWEIGKKSWPIFLSRSCCDIYLWSKVVCFVYVCHTHISQTTVLHVASWYLGESFQCIELHWLGLRLFGAMVWKLLIIVLFF
jgi:hypothetical protein